MGLDDIKTYIIGIIAFSIIIGGVALIAGSFFNSDASLADGSQIASFNSSLNTASQVESSVGGMGDSISEVSAEKTGALGWLNALIGSVFNGLKAIWGSLGFMGAVGSQAGSLLGIPPFIVALLILIPTVIIIFAIWSAITRT